MSSCQVITSCLSHRLHNVSLYHHRPKGGLPLWLMIFVFNTKKGRRKETFKQHEEVMCYIKNYKTNTFKDLPFHHLSVCFSISSSALFFLYRRPLILLPVISKCIVISEGLNELRRQWKPFGDICIFFNLRWRMEPKSCGLCCHWNENVKPPAMIWREYCLLVCVISKEVDVFDDN